MRQAGTPADSERRVRLAADPWQKTTSPLRACSVGTTNGCPLSSVIPRVRHQALIQDRVDELPVIAAALALSDQADPLGGGPGPAVLLR